MIVFVLSIPVGNEFVSRRIPLFIVMKTVLVLLFLSVVLSAKQCDISNPVVCGFKSACWNCMD